MMKAQKNWRDGVLWEKGDLVLEATLPYPPSVNHYWGHKVFKNRYGKSLVQTYITKDGTQYQKTAGEILKLSINPLYRKSGIFPLNGDLIVEERFWMPDHRKRDLDNVQKALWDTITKARIWVDDSQVKDVRQSFAGVCKDGMTLIRIFTAKEAGA